MENAKPNGRRIPTIPKAGHALSSPSRTFAKCPTGIRGLDQICYGGLPRGHSTLVCGAAGTGKTLLGVEFLVHGAVEYGESGVFVSFEERPADLAANVASLGFDLTALVRSKKLVINHVVAEHKIPDSGEYNLDGLFIRLGAAIDSVRAKRVVLDTIDVLFEMFADVGNLRSELARLFGWLADKGVTTIVTGERGDGTFSRHGIEEYVSDCVILLDQRVTEQIATRRLRIAKYRGSRHGGNEFPFLIEESGLSILPITMIELNYSASTEFVSTGVAAVDDTVGGGKGVFRGSTMLVSGTAGSGKTSLAAQFVTSACRRGERSLYFAFDESPSEIMRNALSIGIDLAKWVKSHTLCFAAARPASTGFEAHIAKMHQLVDLFNPHVAVIDPVSAFESGGTLIDAQSLLMRMIDLLKSRDITTMLTYLTRDAEAHDLQIVGVSSVADSWFKVGNVGQTGESTKGLEIIKTRGMGHSSQIRELRFTDQGLQLGDPVGRKAASPPRCRTTKPSTRRQL